METRTAKPFTLAVPSAASTVVVTDEDLAAIRARERNFRGGLAPVESASTTSPDGTSRQTAVGSTSYSQGVADDSTTDYETDHIVDQKTDD